jgi:hypothetical protein
MSKTSKSGRDYEVGHGKPPKTTQFKKGRSGNPKGRPKGSKNYSTIVSKALKQPVHITKSGVPKTVTALEAVVLTTVKDALGGNRRAQLQVTSWGEQVFAEDPSKASSDTLSRNEQLILDAYTAEITANVLDSMADSEGEPPPSDDSTIKAEEDEDDWLK